MALRVFLTSPMSVESGDNVVDATRLGRPQVRLALAFLATQRHRAVSRHELADVLWAEVLPTTWEAALRGVVSKVRGVFTALDFPVESVIPGSFGFYQLHLPPDAVVDIDEASGQLAGAQAALQAGDGQRACAGAEAARTIAERPFLPGEEGEWVERARTELRSLLLRAFEVESDARLHMDEPVAAAEAAEAALGLEPFRESAHRLLIAAHAASGNRGEALRAYERCRTVLAEALGVSPSPDTEAAYLALLGDEPGREPTAVAATVPAPALPSPPLRPLVGREREQAFLHEAWQQARAGDRRLVLLAGEAGIGKSALALDLAACAGEEGATVLYGRCDREVWTPYAPFVEALARYVSGCPLPLLRRQVAGTGPALGRLLPELAARLPEFSAAGDGDPEGDRHRLFVVTGSLLAAMATSSPLVLVIDDLQWAGDGALLLLRYAARALASVPLLIIVAYRPEETTAVPVFRDVLADLVREPGVVRVDVGRLSDAAAEQLVRETGGEDLPGPLAARLHEDGAGNPMFLTELLRELQQGGGGKVGAADRLGVPTAVSHLVKARRSRLSEQTDRVVGVASGLGAEFALETLHRASDLGTDAVLDAMEEAAAAGLVTEDGVAGRYRFRHRLVRDAVYAQLSETRRARVHARIADVLEATGDVLAPVRAGEVAHHFAMAGPLAPPGKAVDWALRAADVAVQQSSYEQAATLFGRALRLGVDQPRRCQTLIALAGALRKAGRVADARASYLEAVQLARALRDPRALAQCALGMAAGSRGVSAWIADEVRVGLLEEALAVLGEDETEWRAKVLAELAKALYFADDPERRDRLAEEAVATARRIGSPAVLAEALSATRVLRWGPANTELRLACADEIVDLGERAGDRELALRARLGRLGDLVEIGDRESVDAEITAVVGLAADLQQPYYRWRARAWRATHTLVTGDVGAAERAAAAAHAVWGDDVHADAASWSSVFGVMLRLVESRPGDGVPAVRRLAGAYPMVPAYRCLSALVHAAAGRTMESWADFEHFAADGFTRPALDSQWLFAVAALGQTCARLADGARAEALFELLVPFAERVPVLDAFGGGGAFLGPVAHTLGQLAATLGRHSEAEHRFDEAVATAYRFGAQHWAVQAEDARAAARRARAPARAGRRTP